MTSRIWQYRVSVTEKAGDSPRRACVGRYLMAHAVSSHEEACMQHPGRCTAPSHEDVGEVVANRFIVHSREC